MSIASKIIWALGGVLSVTAGIVAFCSPSTTLVSLAIFLGIMLILMGISSICSYFMDRKEMLGAGWALLGGIASVITGIIVLCNGSLVAGLLTTIFAIWVLIMGIIRLMSSFDLKRLGFGKWWISTLVGALLILLAVLSFFQPVINVMMITIMVGLYLVINGIYTFVELYYVNKFEKAAKSYLQKMNAIVIEPDEIITPE